MVDVPTTPTLATIPGVELCSVGFWDISNVDDWHPSAEDLQACVSALACPAMRRPCLKFGHSDGPGDPSIGVIDNVRITDDGQTLVGDFVGVPAWLAEADDQGRSVIASAYPDRSGEWNHDHKCQLGHTHKFVLHSMALLGVVRPGVGTLESLYDLYAQAPLKEEPAMATTADKASTTIDQVRKAYYNGPGVDWMLWIREMYVDPPELIVQNDNDDSVIRVPYEVGGEGEVTFGDPQSVKVEYVNARAKVETPRLVHTSRAEARPQSAPQTTSATAEAEGEKKEDGHMPSLNESLASRLGIEADADDAAILAALDAKIDTAPEPAPAVEDITVDQVAAAAKRHGLMVGDPDTYDQLVADAAAGRKARDKQISDHRNTVVGAAITAGKITPARREHFTKLHEADPEGTETLLASIPDQTAVAFSEIGHADSGGTDSGQAEDLSWFNEAPKGA